MADYREVSQQYAQQGINAALLINGGAAVALLSQAGDLVKAGLADDVAVSMIIWAGGVTLAALTWCCAFMSTRFVDKSEREPDSTRVLLGKSDRLMLAGFGAVMLSIACFAAGCILLARAFL